MARSTALLLLIFTATTTRGSVGGPYHERVPPSYQNRRASISACVGGANRTSGAAADSVFCGALHPIASRTDPYTVFAAKVCVFMTNHTGVIDKGTLVLTPRVPQDVREGPNFAAYTLLMWAHQHVPTVPRGLWLEFGVADGHSANLTSMHLEEGTASDGVFVVGFDSFQGLPRTWYRYPEQRQWDTRPQGTFSRKGVPPPVRSRVRLVKGLFEATLEGYLTAHPGLPLAFVNVDNDLYEGTKFILQRLYHRLVVGSVLHFHDALMKDFFGCRPQVRLAARTRLVPIDTLSHPRARHRNTYRAPGGAARAVRRVGGLPHPAPAGNVTCPHKPVDAPVYSASPCYIHTHTRTHPASAADTAHHGVPRVAALPSRLHIGP